MEVSENPAIGVKIDYWTESDLVDLLMENPRIARKYFTQPLVQFPFLIGVLDGYIRNPESEVLCASLFTNYGVENWVRRLSSEGRFIVENIHTTQISNRYDAIINPFGEVFPEEDRGERKTYNDIKRYISDGGVFVNAGGYPLFYTWDVHRGRREVSIDTQRVIKTPDGNLFVGYLFSDTHIAKDFRTFLEGGGITEVVVSQTDEDRERVGDLVSAGGSNIVRQFRAVRANTPNFVPLLRAEENKLFPIAAIPNGKGYLIIGGMNIVTNSEFEKLALCVENWFAKKVRALYH